MWSHQLIDLVVILMYCFITKWTKQPKIIHIKLDSCLSISTQLPHFYQFSISFSIFSYMCRLFWNLNVLCWGAYDAGRPAQYSWRATTLPPEQPQTVNGLEVSLSSIYSYIYYINFNNCIYPQSVVNVWYVDLVLLLKMRQFYRFLPWLCSDGMLGWDHAMTCFYCKAVFFGRREFKFTRMASEQKIFYALLTQTQKHIFHDVLVLVCCYPVSPS